MFNVVQSRANSDESNGEQKKVTRGECLGIDVI